MPRNCINHPDSFYYVCGSFTTKAQRCPITTDLKKIYKLYFRCPLGDQDKSWAPHVICTSCSNGLRDWLNRQKAAMPFAIPMVWREPQDHLNDCYFCHMNKRGFSAKTKHKIIYLSLNSAIRPVPHDDSLPVPLPPHDGLASVEGDDEYNEGTAGNSQESSDPNFMADDDSQLETFTQAELNDLVYDLNLSKDKAEFLASRLKQKHLIAKGVAVTHYTSCTHM